MFSYNIELYFQWSTGMYIESHSLQVCLPHKSWQLQGGWALNPTSGWKRKEPVIPPVFQVPLVKGEAFRTQRTFSERPKAQGDHSTECRVKNWLPSPEQILQHLLSPNPTTTQRHTIQVFFPVHLASRSIGTAQVWEVWWVKNMQGTSEFIFLNLSLKMFFELKK